MSGSPLQSQVLSVCQSAFVSLSASEALNMMTLPVFSKGCSVSMIWRFSLCYVSYLELTTSSRQQGQAACWAEGVSIWKQITKKSIRVYVSFYHDKSVSVKTHLPGVILSFHLLQGLGKTRPFPFGEPWKLVAPQIRVLLQERLSGAAVHPGRNSKDWNLQIALKGKKWKWEWEFFLHFTVHKTINMVLFLFHFTSLCLLTFTDAENSTTPGNSSTRDQQNAQKKQTPSLVEPFDGVVTYHGTKYKLVGICIPPSNVQNASKCCLW